MMYKKISPAMKKSFFNKEYAIDKMKIMKKNKAAMPDS